MHTGDRRQPVTGRAPCVSPSVEGMQQQQDRRRTFATAALGLALTSLATGVSLAAGADPALAAGGGSNYAQWSVSGGSGSMTIPIAGFPTASLNTTSSSTQVPSGSSAYLNASTPFGATYGSSQNQPYALLRTAPGTTPSTTTLTFATPPTAGSWGFALGDIDADLATLSATDANGQPVSIADLGFQSTFNYCQGKPLPSTCGGSTSTDQPTWDPALGTLTGNVADTNGASGWFRPSVALKTLTIKFSAQSGLPVYQLWVAANTRSIGGRVTSYGDCPPPTYKPLALLTESGDAVKGPDGQAVYATVGSNGEYQFPDVAPGAYKVAATTPNGFNPVGDPTKTADVSGASVSDVNFEFHCRTTVRPVTEIDVPPIDVPPGGPSDITIPPNVDPAKPITITDPPRHGTVTVDEPGGAFIYTPDPGYQGHDRFTFKATARDGSPVLMTIHLLVRPMLPATGAFGTTDLAGLGLGVLVGGLLLWLGSKLWRRDRGAKI